jgi:methionyl-tRNA synthetase
MGYTCAKARYENKVFYVWFDAPIGYIAITAKEREGLEGVVAEP